MPKLSNKEILSKVQEAFKEAMGAEVTVGLNSEKDNIGEWDSINHLNLVVELESNFNLDLSMKEIEDLNSVRQIVEIIQQRQS